MDLFGFTDEVSWQDIVLTLGSVGFLIALIPTILGAAKPAPLTSFATGFVLVVFAVTYATLDLRFASVVTAITGLAWFFILWQSLRRNGNARCSGSVEDDARPQGP